MEKNNSLMSGKGENGKWITVNGSHIFVEDGQTVEDAMNKKFNSTSAKIDQEKQREDAYVDKNNKDSINKQTTIDNIANDIKDYKGSGYVELILPGGKWCSIRKQEDGTYLARTSLGKQYFSSVDEAKNYISKAYQNDVAPVSKHQAKANYLKDKINNSWYVNAKKDYGIDGKVKDISIDGDTINVVVEENGKIMKSKLPYAGDYTGEQLYNIWQGFPDDGE